MIVHGGHFTGGVVNVPHDLPDRAPRMSVVANRRRHAPSAFGDDLRRFWNLTVTLAVTDFKLRYFGSVLGYFWSLARPLLFFGVVYVVFTQVLDVGGDMPHYPVYLC